MPMPLQASLAFPADTIIVAFCRKLMYLMQIEIFLGTNINHFLSFIFIFYLFYSNFTLVGQFAKQKQKNAGKSYTHSHDCKSHTFQICWIVVIASHHTHTHCISPICTRDSVHVVEYGVVAHRKLWIPLARPTPTYWNIIYLGSTWSCASTAPLLHLAVIICHTHLLLS